MSIDKDLLRQLCDLEVPNAIQLSSSGNEVLYSTQLSWGQRKGKHGRSTLWLAETGKLDSARKLTSGSFNDHAPAWHPDGERIAFVSDRAKQGEQWAIYIQGIKDDADAEAITPADNQQYISMFSFSPDGKAIAFVSTDAKTAEQKKREEDDGDMQVWGSDWSHARLRVINMLTKEITNLILDRHVVGMAWSPNGHELGIVTCKTPDGEEPFVTGSTISVVDAGLTTVRDLCHFPTGVYSLTWTDDKLYFWSGAPAGTMFCGFAVYAVGSTSGTSDYERVGFGVENDACRVIKVDRRIVVQLSHGLESRISLLSGQVLYSRKENLEAFDAVFGGDTDRPILAVATSNSNQPVEVFTIADDKGTLVQLSNHGAVFENHKFGTCSFLSRLSTDGEAEIDSLYLTPTTSASSDDATAAPKQPLPTVVLIHGGPTTRLTNAFNTYYYMWTPYLLSLGYGVLLTNYRGSTGRGERFGGYSVGGVGKYDCDDIITSTQYAIDLGYADKDRMVVGGWSHGGLLTLLCSVRNGLHGHDWKFKASISGASMSDIDSMALTSDFGSTYQPEIHEGRAMWNMDQNDTRNRRASALWAFKEAMEHSKQTGEMVVPPMLILHGADDTRCHVSNTWGMRRALESQGLPFEMIIYPRSGHIITEQTFWVDMALRIGKWCDRYIGRGME
jgi:dipeptidyl aminopeptidase/acylaminoacyl peptidase